jgi:hypothetical protein
LSYRSVSLETCGYTAAGQTKLSIDSSEVSDIPLMMEPSDVFARFEVLPRLEGVFAVRFFPFVAETDEPWESSLVAI